MSSLAKPNQPLIEGCLKWSYFQSKSIKDSQLNGKGEILDAPAGFGAVGVFFSLEGLLIHRAH
jgi:hypothetical protein